MEDFKILSPAWRDYELIDCGGFEKLERWGRWITRRPEPQAIWRRSMPESEWGRLATAVFIKEKGSDERGSWKLRRDMPQQWFVGFEHGGMSLKMRLGLTSFKHVGLFPEQAENWVYVYENIQQMKKNGIEKPRVLNLFAYTGGASLAAASAGAEVTHVDSVRQVITWANENLQASGLSGVRWIVDDAMKFIRREVKRGNKYNGIVLDPPAYGRGPDGEKWVLEKNICEMLECCASLIAPGGAFVVLNLYSMGLSALLARSAANKAFGEASAERYGELFFNDRSGTALPLGVYYRAKF